MLKDRLFFLSILFLMSCSRVSAKEITILYTGDTHGMIYPCNCPIEPDGGVARRATLVNELKKANPNSLLVDAGGFFAGGVMDEYSQNTELDMKRTLVNIKAMEMMKYDAIAVADDEFNFGSAFFKDNLAGEKMQLISCNIKSAKIPGYIIKDLSGTKIGVAAVATIISAQKSGDIAVEPPIAAARKALGELRKEGADIVILLGHLSESEETALLSEIKDIDIYISGHRRPKEGSNVKTESTLVLRPAFEGRKLGKLTLHIADNNKDIIDYKVEELRLSDKVADDPQILAILPHCFSDANCKKEGNIGECLNPGNPNSSCVFKEANKVNLTVIAAKECLTCDPNASLGFLKRVYPGLSVTYLYYPDPKSEKLTRELGIEGLPAYILGKEVENDKNFDNMKVNLEARNGYYLLRPAFSGVGYFLKRQKEKGKVDLFISLFDKESADLLPEIAGFNPELHFLAVENAGVFSAQAGVTEIEEDLRSVCVKKYYPERFFDYLACRAKNASSSWWQECASGMDEGKIHSCARSSEGEGLLRNNIDLSKELRVMFGPLILLDNVEVFGIQGKPKKKDLESILRR
ncbi:MAG TPA: hypothetical protein VMD04_05215 [Candidatus Margulisiibacteriota bacterium]|nr:hypothetical protein [Candidatus Margulisiibacteriota bacterium]